MSGQGRRGRRLSGGHYFVWNIDSAVVERPRRHPSTAQTCGDAEQPCQFFHRALHWCKLYLIGDKMLHRSVAFWGSPNNSSVFSRIVAGFPVQGTGVADAV